MENNILLASGEGSNIYYNKIDKTVTKNIPSAYIKKLYKNGYDGNKFLSTEIYALKKMSGEDNFPIYYDSYVTESGDVCINMSKVDGVNLVDICLNNVLPENEIKYIFKNIAKAIIKLHNNDIAHRDIKLENIMYDREQKVVTIIDFGLAIKYKKYKYPKLKYIFSKKKVIYTSEWCGSIEYAAPEILNMLSYNPEYADIWSLGVCLYVLLTNSFPFYNTNTSNIKEDIINCRINMDPIDNNNAIDLLNKILKINPSERISLNNILNHTYLNI